MFSEKDFERLWFLYKTEGEPKGVSINSFCIGPDPQVIDKLFKEFILFTARAA